MKIVFRLCVAASLAGAAFRASATGIAIRDTKLDRTHATVEFVVEWKNAWRNERNHDGAWLFVKLRRGARVAHALLAPEGSSAEAPAVGSPPQSLEISADRVGAFCFASRAHRGTFAAKVRLALDPRALADDANGAPAAEVFAIEMVSVPEGAFTLGDPDPSSLDEAAFFRVGEGGKPDGLYVVKSEAAIPVGVSKDSLDYQVRVPDYQGDRRGPVPAEFPKGFRAFWIMKYEVSQGQYAAFLNTLSDEATEARANNAGRTYRESRGSIRLEARRYVADRPDRPANWMGWDDGCAFVAWAGLRPMTELEYEKAARGPRSPQPLERPWGTANIDRLLRRVQPDDDLATSGAADESLLSDATLELFGASPYWVMDLAGSVWERAVTIGHPSGRTFRGTHGDGRPSHYFGLPSNADWPHGDGAGGFGYRGGGFYEQSMKFAILNPWSPVGWRRYAAWGDGPRSIAYGFRGVRTADLAVLVRPFTPA